MENKLTVKDSAISFLTTFILCQLGTAFFAVAGLIVANIFGINNSTFISFLNTCFGSLLLTLCMDIIIIVCYFYFTKNKNNKIITKPQTKKILIYIAIAILCYITLYPIVNVFNNLIYKFFPENNLPYQLTTTNYFISLISMVILPAITEELLFRGLIFKGLQKNGNVFAIIVSSIMFALFHLSMEQTIYPLLMGIVFAVIMCYENNIIYCITVHLANNFTTLTLQYFKISLTFSHWTYFLLALVSIIIFATVIILVIKKLCNTTKVENNNISQSVNKTNKIYLISSLTIMSILWLIVQLTTIF